jgi:S-adenosylmethionine synthetase
MPKPQKGRTRRNKGDDQGLCSASPVTRRGTHAGGNHVCAPAQRELTRIRKSGKVKWLRPDAKSQVSVRYVNDQPVEIINVVISTQHAHDAKHETIKEFCIEEVIKKTLPKNLLTRNTTFLINPTGRFVVGGPQGDTGLTGRKIIVDSYGGMGRHGGGAFSGKDPSKVDRSAAYMGRYVAKNIVAAGIATSAEIQFAYAIGYPEPVSVCINTFGTAADGITDEQIEKAVREVFSFKPANIIKQLNLLRPIYSKTTNYGHFGKTDPDITWEKADKQGDLRRALGLDSRATSQGEIISTIRDRERLTIQRFNSIIQRQCLQQSNSPHPATKRRSQPLAMETEKPNRISA